MYAIVETGGKQYRVRPGDTIAVELKYTELLVPTDGVYEFVYPTVVGPRYSERRESEASPGDDFVKAPYTHQGEPPRSEFHLSGVLSTGVPITELASPSHQVTIRSIGASLTGSDEQRQQMLPRLVRDLSHELGKRIELDMRGADTELDRQVLDVFIGAKVYELTRYWRKRTP